MQEGSDFVGGPEADGVVLTEALAHAIDLHRGDQAALLASDVDGALAGKIMRLAGTMHLQIAGEKKIALAPLALAQRLLKMPNQVTEIVVAVEPVEQSAAVAEAIRQRLGPDHEVTTWSDLEPNVADVLDFQNIVIGMVGVVFLAIAFFGVVNTMLMSVMERSREIGTMMALGLRRRFIVMVFLQEAVLLSCVAAALGLGAARTFEWAVGRMGGFVVATPGSTVERYHLIPQASVGMIAFAVLGAVVVSLGAAAYPAWKAATLRPVEALRAV